MGAHPLSGAIRDSHWHTILDGRNGRDGRCGNPAPAARQLTFAGGSTADRSQSKGVSYLAIFGPGITGLFTTVC